MEDMFRMPKNDGSGGWYYSRPIAEQEISKVLGWRNQVLGGEPCDILSFELQKQVQRMHLDDWIQQNAEAVQIVRARHRGTNHRIIRDIASLHRVECFHRFGGREWMYLIIAFGRLDEEILDAMNEAARQRIQEHKEKKGAEWIEEDEVQRQRASAAPRGRVMGVQHSKSEAKLLREAAKKEQKKLEQADEAWNAGRRTMSNGAYRALVRRVENLWRQADRASAESGRAHVGRNHEWSCVGQVDDSLVARAITIYRAKREKASASSRGPP